MTNLKPVYDEIDNGLIGVGISSNGIDFRCAGFKCTGQLFADLIWLIGNSGKITIKKVLAIHRRLCYSTQGVRQD
jgi:hypothetical protein